MYDHPMPSRLPPYSGAPYMPSQQCSQSSSQELLVVAQAAPLFLAVDLGEVGAQGGQALPVALLEPDDRTVELTLGPPLRALDAHPPRQLVERRQRDEVAEAAPRRRGGPRTARPPRCGAGRR